jgi:hypothetical protein
MHEYQIKYIEGKWQLFHTDFGLVGEFSSFDDAERFINWN